MLEEKSEGRIVSGSGCCGYRLILGVFGVWKKNFVLN